MKITVNQLRRIIKEEVQKTLNENVEALEALKSAVVTLLNQKYGGEGYDLQGIADTVFSELSPQELLGMSVEALVAKCRELMD